MMAELKTDAPGGDSKAHVKAELSKTFRFEAAHSLPNVPPEHKCAGRHGHSYQVTVTVAGEVHETLGWVMDFDEIKKAVEPLIRQLDHTQLNDVEGLSNPTSEQLAKWLWDRIRPRLPQLAAVSVAESVNSLCTYRGG
jgi:6-pyruvoyltetrahydropterin/6-carboxytetrahydropterin synthase